LEEKLKRFSIWTSHQLEPRMLIMLLLGSWRKLCNISPHLKIYDNKYGVWSVPIISQLLCSRKRYFCKCHFAFRHLLTCPVQLSKFEIHIQQIERWWQQYHLLILMRCFPGLNISHFFLVSDDGMILAWSSYMYCEISQNELSAVSGCGCQWYYPVSCHVPDGTSLQAPRVRHLCFSIPWIHHMNKLFLNLSNQCRWSEWELGWGDSSFT
jgi:hypothetical protein